MVPPVVEPAGITDPDVAVGDDKVYVIGPDVLRLPALAIVDGAITADAVPRPDAPEPDVPPPVVVGVVVVNVTGTVIEGGGDGVTAAVSAAALTVNDRVTLLAAE